MARNTKKRTATPPPAPANQNDEAAAMMAEDAVAATGIVSPLAVPESQRESYWNGLLADVDQLRAAIATVEFFALLRAMPPALWEKRCLVYLYRTAPKVRNQSGEKSYIDKIARPFDEDFIKENHGGGSYLCYLNLDRETQLKQISFAIDGPPKMLPGQVLVDAAGNTIPVAPTPAQTERSQMAEAISATQDAQRASVKILEDSSAAALEMQSKVYEKSLGVLGGAGNTESKLLEKLVDRALAPPTAAADPLTMALTLMEKLDGIIARRNPQPEAREPASAGALTEQLGLVETITGRSIQDILAPGKSSANDWINTAIAAGVKLIETMPTLMSQFMTNQERQFQRQMEFARMRAGQPGATPMPELPATFATQPGARVAPPPATAFTGQTIPFPANGAASTTTEPPVIIDTDVPMDPTQAVPIMAKLIQTKFQQGYSGEAVAQTLDVMFAGLLEQIAPVVLDENELRKFLTSIPDLLPLLGDKEWPEFQAGFVEFVRDEYAETLPANGPAPGEKKPIMPAATA
jgi:hypothetical protein